jgi:hypothetical protein
MRKMEELKLDSIIEANKWFIEADENDVMEMFNKQPTLTGFVNVILDEDLDFLEDFPKDLFYGLFGTILKSYYLQYDNKVKEVIEQDIEAAFQQQEEYAQNLSKSLGIDNDSDDDQSDEMTKKLSEIEEKMMADSNFSLEEDGLGDLASLLNSMNSNMRQSTLHTFIHEEIEHSEIEDDVAGFLNQQLAVVIDSIENMMDKYKSL